MMVSEKKKKVTPLASPSYIENGNVYEKVKKKRRRGLARRLVVFFLFVALSAASLTSMITSQQQTIQEKQEQKAQQEEKLAQLEDQGEKLKGKVKKLHDPEYIGQIARRDYLMTKNGEFVFKTSSDD